MVEEQEECPRGQSGQEKYIRQGGKEGRLFLTPCSGVWIVL